MGREKEHTPYIEVKGKTRDGRYRRETNWIENVERKTEGKGVVEDRRDKIEDRKKENEKRRIMIKSVKDKRREKYNI